MKKFRKIQVFTLIFIGTLFAADIERITVIGYYDRTYDQLFVFLNLPLFEEYNPYFTGEVLSSSAAGITLKNSFCAMLEGNKPEHCEGNPDASLFQPNGCSVPNIAVATAWKGTFNGSCNSHDMCYNNPGANRATCDSNFKTNMDMTCIEDMEISTNSKLRNACYSASAGYYAGVRVKGGAFWNDAQSDTKCSAWSELKDKHCS